MIKRCSSCRHYTPGGFDGQSIWQGRCALMGDANEIFESREDTESPDSTPNDRCFGWDYESYYAGVYVGQEFGCIHWEVKP